MTPMSTRTQDILIAMQWPLGSVGTRSDESRDALERRLVRARRLFDSVLRALERDRRKADERKAQAKARRAK